MMVPLSPGKSRVRHDPMAVRRELPPSPRARRAPGAASKRRRVDTAGVLPADAGGLAPAEAMVRQVSAREQPARLSAAVLGWPLCYVRVDRFGLAEAPPMCCKDTTCHRDGLQEFWYRLECQHDFCDNTAQTVPIHGSQHQPRRRSQQRREATSECSGASPIRVVPGDDGAESGCSDADTDGAHSSPRHHSTSQLHELCGVGGAGSADVHTLVVGPGSLQRSSQQGTAAGSVSACLGDGVGSVTGTDSDSFLAPDDADDNELAAGRRNEVVDPVARAAFNEDGPKGLGPFAFDGCVHVIYAGAEVVWGVNGVLALC